MLEKYKYKVILQLLGLKDKDIAKVMNYKTTQSYQQTSKKGKIEKLVELIHNKTINTFDNRGFVKPIKEESEQLKYIKALKIQEHADARKIQELEEEIKVLQSALKDCHSELGFNKR